MPAHVFEDDALAAAQRRLDEGNELLQEIRKARQPNFKQPLEAVAKFNALSKGQTGPFRSMGHFFKSVQSIGQSGNWQNHREMGAYLKTLPSGMNETQGADGGFLIPPEYSQQILMRTYQNDLLSRTVMFPLSSSNSIKIPAINETSRADGSRFGGVQAYWRSEAGTAAATKPSLAQVTLTVDSLTMFVQVTQEMIEDASGVALETFLNLVATQELAFKIGDAIVNGDGETKPAGLMKSPSKIAVAKESGQAAKTIVAANVLNMWSRLHLSCWSNAVWLCDQSILPQLAQMTIGTAGANMVVYQPPGGLSASPYATLQGRPIIPVEFCQQLGTEGDLILTDLSTYLTASKGGMQTASSIHVLFLTNELMYRFIMRLDGKPWWLSALTPKSGGPTQSNIVTLATRS